MGWITDVGDYNLESKGRGKDNTKLLSLVVREEEKVAPPLARLKLHLTTPDQITT